MTCYVISYQYIISEVGCAYIAYTMHILHLAYTIFTSCI